MTELSVRRFTSFFLDNKLAIIEGLTYALAFSLSFPKGFSAYTLGVWFAMCVLLSVGHWRENLSAAISCKQSWPSVALLLLFAIGLLSLTYASDAGAVIHRLFNARFPVFCIPLGVLLANVRVPLSRVLKSYFFGVTCFVLYSYLMVALMMNDNHFLEALDGDGWSGLTHLFGDVVNRAYTNTNVVLAVFSSVFLLLTNKVQRRYYWIYGLALAIISFFLFVNTSRMVLLSAMAVVFVIALSFASTNRKFFIGGGVCFLLLCCAVLFTDNRISNSFNTIVNSLVNGTSSFSDPRFMIWKAGVAIDPHTFLWGYGENNVDGFLFQEYERMGWAEGIAWHYLCHNQYLELYLELGLPGLFAFVGAMVLAVLAVTKKYKRFVASFVMLFALIMFTECYISRTAGALFFAFFLSVVCMSVGADAHLPVPEKLLTARHKIGISLLAAFSVIALLFVFVYRQKMAECYTLSKADDIVVANEQRDGLPLYRLDAYSRCSTADNNAFSYYVFFISRNHKQKVRFCIDCFVSDDFSGDWAFVANLDKEHRTLKNVFYNMAAKGSWQTLAIDLPPGDNFVNLDMGKKGVDDFSALRGFVLYSNPRWVEIN